MSEKKLLLMSTKNYNGVPEFTEFENEAELLNWIGWSGNQVELGISGSGKHQHITSLLSAEELPMPTELEEIRKADEVALEADRRERDLNWENRVKKDRERDRQQILKLFQVETFTGIR